MAYPVCDPEIRLKKICHLQLVWGAALWNVFILNFTAWVINASHKQINKSVVIPYLIIWKREQVFNNSETEMETALNWINQTSSSSDADFGDSNTSQASSVELKIGGELQILFSKTSVTITFCVLVLLVLIGTTGNAFMAHTIWKTPQLRSRTNILLGWLTISDIVSGFTGTLFIAVGQLCIFVLSNNPCNYTKLLGASYTFTKTSILSSQAIMISIAVDRYVAIFHPFHYYSWITDRWVKTSVIISFASGLSIGFANAIYLVSKVDFTSCANPYSVVMQQIIDNGAYAIVSMVLIVVYGRIFKIAIAQRSKIDVIVASSIVGHSNNGIGSVRKEWKAVRTTALIIGWYVLLWFPYEVGRIMQGLGDTSSAVQIINAIGLCMGLANHACGWIIYGTSSREFREALVANLKCKKPPN